MSESVRYINSFFRTATRADVDAVLAGIILSERQAKVFESYYLKRLDVCFIADTLGTSERVVKKELETIRRKMLYIISTK